MKPASQQPLGSPAAPSLFGSELFRSELIMELVRRQLKVTYKRPALGVLWAVIAPVAQLLVLYWLFGVIFQSAFPAFASFLFVGLMAWSWFQSSIGQGVVVIVNNRSLICQPRFPSAVLPPVVVLARLSEMVITIPVLLLVLALNGVSVGVSALALPLVIGVEGLLIAALVYPLAALNVRFRDTQHVVAAALGAVFFLSGIFYEVDRIPGSAKLVFLLNPMVHLVQAYRAILLDGTLPEWLPLGQIAVVSLLALPLGYASFRRSSARFVEEL